MYLGHWLVLIGLTMTIGSAVLYLVARSNQMLVRLARRLFYAGVGCTVATEATLLYLLYNRRYDVDYVFRVSDNTLPPMFRISAAWAAQEGSFLLWAFYTAILGLIAIRYIGKAERAFMAVYSSILASILGILAYQSPFLSYEAKALGEFMKEKLPIPPELTAVGNFMPPDGHGMNAALENYWMVIHPPIIFLGFSLLGVLFAFGLSALFTKQWDDSARRIRPWALVSVAILGFGIALGGFWAYETLGWGGFWAWDPVENVSFLPWLAVGALVHGVYLQITRHKMRWMNLMLAMLPFLLFTYGTFITRSGALANMSVHAFAADLQSGALLILLWQCRIATAIAIGVWLWRLPAIRREKRRELVIESAVNRDSAFTVSVFGLLISTLLVGVGTFLPLILQQWLNRTPVKMEADYYHMTGAAVIIPLAALMAIGPWMSWRGMKGDKLLERVLLPWLLTLAFAIAAFFLWFPALSAEAKIWERFTYIIPLLVSVLCFFALISNLIRIRSVWKNSRTAIGGYITHAGVAMLMLGLVVSTVGQKKQEVNLVRDQPVKAFGYTIQFAGMSSNPDIKTNRVMLKFTDAKGRKTDMRPKFYLNHKSLGENGEPMTVRWPSIKVAPLGDLYVSFADNPRQTIDQMSHPMQTRLKLGETTTQGPYKIKFVEFVRQGAMGQAGFKVGAKMLVTYQGVKFDVRPMVAITDQGPQTEPAQMPGGAIMGMQPNPADKTALIVLINVPGHPETVMKEPGAMDWMIPLEVFYKPLTIFVWLGALLLLVGGLIAARRRIVDARGHYAFQAAIATNASSNGAHTPKSHKREKMTAGR